jgi:hypothetical protein
LVLGMEMRWIVFIVVHPDHYTEKSGNSGKNTPFLAANDANHRQQ